MNREILYPQRKEDLKRLIYYLEKFNIIGINAPWGEGKSFLFNKLKESYGEKHEIIEVDILACNFNELRVTLINELESLMYKNRIISKYSS
ncbi:P-loop NTPase fold protein [Halanaerobium congolense]|uniref:P-loop NTPase fold protein n=1 Tax=Halanaerobium congolense TaxID=54121 RepID=UPI001F2DBCFE|nr:P-loop NTPase fold protein [Halanaerobium congolense]